MLRVLSVVVAILSFQGLANAQALNLWHLRGGEARVCDQANGGSCVTLSCAQDRKLLFNVNGSGVNAGQGSIIVDNRVLGTGRFGGKQGFASIFLDPRTNRDIFSAIAGGSRLNVRLQEANVSVSLSGSSKAINTLTNLCTRDKPPAYVGTAKEERFARQVDEQDVFFESEPVWEAFSRHNELDIWGGDIRSGLEDPALAGISRKECARLCLSTSGCGAYTFNEKDGDVCFLKTGLAKMTAYNGATTGIRINPGNEIVPPATRGPLPVVNSAAAWRENDTHQSFANRQRKLAAPLAQSCAAERAILSNLAQGFTAVLPEASAVAGEKVAIKWSGNSLTERIPVWLSVHSPNLVRFDGASAMVLGPDAPNPFGIAEGLRNTRAMVSLWGRGAGQAGEIAFNPLRSGETELTVSLVAWLRACEEEVVLQQKQTFLDVQPSHAVLVIGTPASRADMTHRFDITAFDRRVEFGDARFRLTSISDQTEIVERDGNGAQMSLSPTGRFLLIGTEVVDVIDGATVAEVNAPEYWAAGDSFLFGSNVPWGTTDVAATFGAREIIEDQVTSPSCCMATPESAHFAIDLENGIMSLRGYQGHSLGPIQGRPYVREMAGNGFASDGDWTVATQVEFTYSLGPVAPVFVDTGFSAPGLTPIAPPLKTRAIEIDRDFRHEDVVVASLFRGTGQAAVSAFERIGIELMDGVASRHLVEPWGNGPVVERTAESDARRLNDLRRELAALGDQYGWSFDALPEPGSLYAAADCFHYLLPDGGGEGSITDQTVYAKPDALAFPQGIDQMSIIENGDASFLLGRMECQAGATGGTLRGQSYLFAMHLKHGAQPGLLVDTQVANYGYLASDRQPQFQDWAFEARMFGDKIVAHNGRGGRIMLFDPYTSEVQREWTNVPSGSLMVEVFPTSDQNNVVQMNSDGGFHIHRVSDGVLVLSGRIVEDEIAVWTVDYRFDYTAEAAALIDLRFPGLDGQFSLDRFKSLLREPGLALSVLNGTDIAALPVPVPPEISGSIMSDGPTIQVSAALTSGRRANEIRLYQDGVLTHTETVTQDTGQLVFSAERLPGTRHASLVAVNSDGLASNAITTDLGAEITGGTRRALAVAFDIYQDDGLPDLNYAKADADRFMRAMSDLPNSVPAFDAPDFAGGRRAGPAEVLAAIDTTLDGLGAGDHAVLFFAGHGLQSQDGEFYFATHTTQTDDLAGTGLRWNDVAERLAKSSARITVLIDACHSGSAGTQGYATNDGAVAGLSAVPSNIVILAASKGRQQSIEARSQGGGLFTVALERVLLRERDIFDKDSNGRIEASELTEGVSGIVSIQSEGRQVPWMTKGRIVGDFAIF